MTGQKTDNVRLENELEKRHSYFQVDVMKALMMILVIVDHSTTHNYMHQFYTPFWERIAIPVLIVIMGFNMGNSFKNKGDMTLKQMYSGDYFISKLKRYVIPYLGLYIIHTIIYWVVQFAGFVTISNFPYDAEWNMYLGYTPFYGPGMWFIPVIFTSILIFPLLYKCFSKQPILTLIGCFAIEIGFMVFKYELYTDWHVTSNFFSTHILYMFSGIGLGLWLTQSHDILSKKNIFYWALLPISLIYLWIYADQSLGAARDFFEIPWLGGDYNHLVMPYSAFLFLLAMKFIPEKPNPKNKFTNFIRRISKSTYHILLAQMFYFSIVYHFFLQMNDYWSPGPFVFDGAPINYLWFFPLNLIITFSLGLLWYEAEKRFFAKKDTSVILKKIYYSLLFLAAIFFIIRFISQFAFFSIYPIP